MKRKAKNGEQIFPVVEVRLFYPGNEKSLTRRYRAAAKQGFTDEGIDGIVSDLSDAIEKKFPGHEYEMVELAPNRFNFVHRKAPDLPMTRTVVNEEPVAAS